MIAVGESRKNIHVKKKSKLENMTARFAHQVIGLHHNTTAFRNTSTAAQFTGASLPVTVGLLLTSLAREAREWLWECDFVAARRDLLIERFQEVHRYAKQCSTSRVASSRCARVVGARWSGHRTEAVLETYTHRKEAARCQQLMLQSAARLNSYPSS